MTNARQKSLWHRAGPIAAVGTLLLGATALGFGCGDSDTTSTGGSGGTASNGGSNPGGSGPSTGGTHQGGGGSTGTAGSNPGSLTAKVVVSDETKFVSPFDATPDAAGATVYFTAIDTSGDPAVFKVKASGGAVTTLAHGAPLVAPFNVATNKAGDKLFVADPGAELATGDRGVIWQVPEAGGTPKALDGTNGVSVRGLVVDGSDTIYFSGIDATGKPEVVKVSANGGTASVVFAGAPLVDPSGVAVARNGDVYVADTVGSSRHEAQILRIHNGAATVVVDDLRVNYPAGIALDTDDTDLLVSALADDGTDVIVEVAVTAKGETPFTKSGAVDLTKLGEPAGMHRSVVKNLFTWVDSFAGPKGTGTVYLLSFE